MKNNDIYFKITNSNEIHHGYQYNDGMNILTEKFNDNVNQSCCAGGFYFTNAKNIFKYINYGIYLRHVSFPTTSSAFMMIKDKANDKWRANMIILEKRYDLFTVETFKYLINCGADIHACDDFALHWCAANGYLNIVKFLVECGANVNAGNDYALRSAAENGHLDIVKYLVKSGANVEANQNDAIVQSVGNGHLDVVKYLAGCGANLHTRDDSLFRLSLYYGFFDIHNYLKSKCSLKYQ